MFYPWFEEPLFTKQRSRVSCLLTQILRIKQFSKAECEFTGSFIA